MEAQKSYKSKTPQQEKQSLLNKTIYYVSSSMAISLLILRTIGMAGNEFIKYHGSNCFDGLMAASFIDLTQMRYSKDKEPKPWLSTTFAIAVEGAYEFASANFYHTMTGRPFKFDYTDFAIVSYSALAYALSMHYLKIQQDHQQKAANIAALSCEASPS